MPDEPERPEFTLISPLGGKFKYYYQDGEYRRKALDAKARLTQEQEDKVISEMVYAYALRKYTQTDGLS